MWDNEGSGQNLVVCFGLSRHKDFIKANFHSIFHQTGTIALHYPIIEAEISILLWLGYATLYIMYSIIEHTDSFLNHDLKSFSECF